MRLATLNRKLSILDWIESSNIIGRRGTALIFIDGMISFIMRVLKHLQQGIPLFCHKLRGTIV